jgi:DNA-binding NarL/FixJ family response regulator
MVVEVEQGVAGRPERHLRYVFAKLAASTSVWRPVQLTPKPTAQREAHFPIVANDEHTGRVATLGKEVTARESEVVALLCKHLTNAQIAEALFISERTVESHVAALLRKYQVPDRRSLARLVAAAGGRRLAGGCRCR